MQPKLGKERAIRNAALTPKEGIQAIIPNSELPGLKDLHKIIEIHVFIGDLGYKPCVRLLRIPKSEIMITGVQIGTGVPPRG